MKPNTIIRLPDGRIGTICYNHLDGMGGVWGIHKFPESAFTVDSDLLPAPDFLLRERYLNGRDMQRQLIRKFNHKTKMECVGTDFEIIDPQEATT